MIFEGLIIFSLSKDSGLNLEKKEEIILSILKKSFQVINKEIAKYHIFLIGNRDHSTFTPFQNATLPFIFEAASFGSA
jgi:hypothetical protein